MNDILLLHGTHISAVESLSDLNPELSSIDVAGIITETGDIKYALSTSICNYPELSQEKPLATEESNEALVLAEYQADVMSGDWANDMLSNPPYAVQLTPESWLSSLKDKDVIA